jgi:hypothetical protein
MAHQWYYRRGEQTHGPISSEELRDLAVGGALQADDRVWSADSTPERSLSGATVVKHLVPLARKATAPDWVDDVRELERLGAEPPPLPPAEGIPDWVADLRQAGVDQPQGPKTPAALEAAAPALPAPAAGVPDWVGKLDVPSPRPAPAHPGLVLDGSDLKPAPVLDGSDLRPTTTLDGSELEEAPREVKKPGPPPLPAADVELLPVEASSLEVLPEDGAELPEAALSEAELPEAELLPEEGEAAPPLAEAFQRACAALDRWVDLDANRGRVLKGDLEALRRDPSVLGIIRPLEGYGALVVDKLWAHLAFLVENRRKYYLARRRQEGG